MDKAQTVYTTENTDILVSRVFTEDTALSARLLELLREIPAFPEDIQP